MNRRDRDRNDYEHDYGRYEGYNRNDDHYHSARNLTDTFEQDYQSHRGHRGDNRHHMDHTYHEGDMGDAYERFRREGRGYEVSSNNQWNDRDRDRYNSGNSGRDSYSSNQDYFRGDQDRYRGDRDYGNMRPRYDTSDRYGSAVRDDYRSRRDDREDYFGAGDYDRTSRSSGRNYDSDTGYPGGYGTSGRYGNDRDRADDNRSNPGQRSYLQNRYY